MQLHELQLQDLKPGIRFKTLLGNIATIERADIMSGHYKYYGSKSTNLVTNDNDDHWFWFSIQDDPIMHGMYWPPRHTFEIIE